MVQRKWLVLAAVWAISLTLVGVGRANPTYLVEWAMDTLNFEFPFKEAYVWTVGLVAWMRGLYFVALTFLTFAPMPRRRSWQ